MATYTYPNSVLDRSDRLLSSLGGFWTAIFGDPQLIRATVAARARLDVQIYQDLAELTAAMSRFTVPIYHREHWTFLPLLESTRNQDLLPRYDGEHRYGDSIFYGQPVNAVTSAFQAPAQLKRAPVILNRLTAPSLTWTEGLDYVLRDGLIIFRENPFTNDLVAKRDIFTDNEITDREAGLWIFHADYDWETIHTQFGYVLGEYLESSENSRQLLNAVFDAFTEGSNQRVMSNAVAAITGVPVAREQRETVELVTTDSRGLLIATDYHVYRFSANATPLVAVGDELQQGAAFVDTVQFHEFARGETPDWLRALTLDEGYLTNGYTQGLLFENKVVPLVVTTEDSHTKISFELGGFPGDVEKFFDELHQRGIAAGQTLAHLLDRRATPVGEPGAASLPATINPLQFLAQNVFRRHVFVIHIRANALGDDAVGLAKLRLLRKIVPPWTSAIVLVRLEYQEERVRMDAPGTTSRSGYQEDAHVFLGKQYVDTVTADNVRERVRVKRIRGKCE